MKGFTPQKLEEVGFFSKIFGSANTDNGWKALNNLLAETDDVTQLSVDEVRSTLKKWGVKFNEENLKNRVKLYRQLADVVYADALDKNDALFNQTAHLAEALDLPEAQKYMADKASKTSAYFERCRRLLTGEEPLDINAINELMGYDYEDGLGIRKQVFQAYFQNKMEDITKAQRYTPDQEEGFRADCAKLDIPFEPKSNVVAALQKYRDLWAAETQPLGDIKLDIPLNEGEIARAAVNCALCENKTIEREDNILEVTRKFSIDETVNFEGEKLKHPKIKEDAVVLVEMGHCILTTERVIFLSEKQAWGLPNGNITGTDFDNVNMVTIHTNTEKGDILFKYPDEAAGVMFIILNRILKEAPQAAKAGADADANARRAAFEKAK